MPLAVGASRDRSARGILYGDAVPKRRDVSMLARDVMKRRVVRVYRSERCRV